MVPSELDRFRKNPKNAEIAACLSQDSSICSLMRTSTANESSNTCSYVLVSLDRSLELREVDISTSIKVDSSYHRPHLLPRKLDFEAGHHTLEFLVGKITVALVCTRREMV